MNDPLVVRFTPRASREVAEAKRWWRTNRTKAPDALEEELKTALELISTMPLIGEKAGNVSLPDVRRIFLDRVKYHLYYRPNIETRTVDVIALWHARRGSGPRL